MVLISCSDSVPQLIAATGTAVFDFSTDDAIPSMRLSIFSSAGSDVRRGSKIQVASRSTGYQWIIEDPQKIESGGTQWTGYTDLQPRQSEIIPTGLYDFFYTDAAGRTTSTTFRVSYPEELLTATADKIKTIVTSPMEESIALYNSDGQLLYFDKVKTTWKKSSDIVRDYHDAVTKRTCLSTVDMSVLCLLPPEKLVDADAQ